MGSTPELWTLNPYGCSDTQGQLLTDSERFENLEGNQVSGMRPSSLPEETFALLLLGTIPPVWLTLGNSKALID